MKKDKSVVMLPTQKANFNILKQTRNTFGEIPEKNELEFTKNKIYIRNTHLINSGNAATNSQSKYDFFHLYILSDEEITDIDVGKWALSVSSNKIYRIGDADFSRKDKDKLIIATTDSDLWYACNHCGASKRNNSVICPNCQKFGTKVTGIPKISIDFSGRYVKSVLKGETIKYILVEYEQLCHQTGLPCGFPCNGDDNCKKSLYPKIRSNGTIIISPLKSFSAKDYIASHGDFKKYYDSSQKRNIWVLGYFGGGSVAITEAYQLAKEYSKSVNVPIETVHIDEVLHSRRFKRFKFIFSCTEQRREIGASKMENVYSWLTD